MLKGKDTVPLSFSRALKGFIYGLERVAEEISYMSTKAVLLMSFTRLSLSVTPVREVISLSFSEYMNSFYSL